MKNTKPSVIIEDLAPLATDSIQDLSPSEINNISGGATTTFQFSFNSQDGESYTFVNNNGEITETGTRPENFDPDGSNLDFAPVTFTPVVLSPVVFGSFVRFEPIAEDNTTEESNGS